MRLEVLRRDEAPHSSDCQLPVAVATTQQLIPLQEGKTLDCPDLQDAASMSNSTPTVTWYHSRAPAAVIHLLGHNCPQEHNGDKTDSREDVKSCWTLTLSRFCLLSAPEKCPKNPFWDPTMQQRGPSLQIHVMLDSFQGLYVCVVQYQRRGRTLNFTRSINVSAVCESGTVGPPGFKPVSWSCLTEPSR